MSIPVQTALDRWNGDLGKEARRELSSEVVHKCSVYDRLNPAECTELMLLTQYFADPKIGAISQFQNRLLNDTKASAEEIYYREHLWRGFTALLSNTKQEDTRMVRLLHALVISIQKETYFLNSVRLIESVIRR